MSIHHNESTLASLLRKFNVEDKPRTKTNKDSFGHQREKSELTKLLESSSPTQSKSAPDVLKSDKDELLLHAPMSPYPRAPHSKSVAMRLFRHTTSLPSLIEKDVERIFVSEESEPPAAQKEKTDAERHSDFSRTTLQETIPSPPSLKPHETLSRFHSHLLKKPKLGHTNLENRGVSLTWLIKMFLYVFFYK